MGISVKPILWEHDTLMIIDQTLLPSVLRYVEINNLSDAEDAIKTLKIRGAPAIGVFAGFAIVKILKGMTVKSTLEAIEKMGEVCGRLRRTRPTAVNLFWAIELMKKYAEENKEMPLEKFFKGLEKTAIDIYKREVNACRMIGIYGSSLIEDGYSILTHCNAGALATGEYGTALAPIYASAEVGKKVKVYVDETRPLLQGARLTAWELSQAGIEVTLICDNMAGVVLKEGKINLVITGADRVAMNGDTANKIGTYSLSILAKYHKVPFYVALPTSTFDLNARTGNDIPIEYRNPDEVKKFGDSFITPEEVNAYNPAFDVTPADNITGFITEKGIIYPPFEDNIRRFVQDK